LKCNHLASLGLKWLSTKTGTDKLNKALLWGSKYRVTTSTYLQKDMTPRTTATPIIYAIDLHLT